MTLRSPVRRAALAAALVLLAAAPGARAAEWLAGDGHVHTCYSHDAYCPQGDDNTGPETFFSAFGTVEQRFTEAALKGLDFLVISDHDDVRAWSDPAFGSRGVIGVRAYERSLPGGGGHAHMLGAQRRYDEEDAGALADALNADGGLFQANHPSYRSERSFTECAQAADPATNPLHWGLGFSVRPDTIEVWNPTALIPPAELFWECWLQRGWRMSATAGSDSHGATQPTLGLPTTWVRAEERTQDGVLDGIRRGRTTLSRLPPALGGARLLLEADADRDGTFEASMGDTVPPGTPMRVRSEGPAGAGVVRVRANGTSAQPDTPLAPGGTVAVRAPDEPGWVRAVLYTEQATGPADPFCRPPASAESPLVLCSTDLAIMAMTSPVYVESPRSVPPRPGPPRPVPAPPQRPGGEDEPDDDEALPPVEQSLAGEPLPDVPRQDPSGDPGRRGAPLPRVRLTLRRAGRGRWVARWRPRGERFDVAVRRGRAGRWRVVARATPRTALRLGRVRRIAVRVRVRAPDGRAGRWVVRRGRRTGAPVGPRD